MGQQLKERKADHLDLCANDEVAFKQCTTLLECVRLVHQSMPELALDEIDTSTTLFGKPLRAPIIIAGMTGGHERAAQINQTLAAVAEERGYGFGLGSQRAMQVDSEAAWTYQVRQHAPHALLLGNIGCLQARDLSNEAISQMIAQVGADALCVHMNPAMELIQSDGDRDFRGGEETFQRLWAQLEVPVIAKETGNGISRQIAARLVKCGIRYVDTSGAGGTSWVGVETLRADGAYKFTGETLWDWGIPTAASIHYCASEGLNTIATGGIRTGLDVARAIALGASAAGIARVAYQAFLEGGRDGVESYLDQVERELRAVMLLCGAANLAALQSAPRIVVGELKDWIEQG